MPSPSRRRVVLAVSVPLSVVALAALVTATAPAQSGCTTHQCDTSCYAFGSSAPADAGCPGITPPNSGELVVNADEVVWESAPAGGNWLDFPGSRSYVFVFPDTLRRDLQNGWTMGYPIVSVSTQADNSTDGGATSSMAAGELAEISHISDSFVVVTNSSCAEYYVRVEVHAYRGDAGPVPGEAGASD